MKNLLVELKQKEINMVFGGISYSEWAWIPLAGVIVINLYTQYILRRLANAIVHPAGPVPAQPAHPVVPPAHQTQPQQLAQPPQPQPNLAAVEPVAHRTRSKLGHGG